jgi:predicted RNA binding protein YcfA (HicA-like mRNA interferase family)
MPRKVRQLKADLIKAGFTIRSGKGSHTVWHHPRFSTVTVIISGKDGDDAEKYQVKEVQNALKKLRGM